LRDGDVIRTVIRSTAGKKSQICRMPVISVLLSGAFMLAIGTKTN
jgi:hypothetical protein